MLTLAPSVCLGCSREETTTAPPPPPPAPSAQTPKPAPTLEELGVGRELLAFRNSEQQLYVASVAAPERAKLVSLTELSVDAPAALHALTLAADDGVLALSYTGASGKRFIALLDARTRSLMRYFPADAAGLSIGDAGRLLLGFGPAGAVVWRVNDAGVVKRLEEPGGFVAGSLSWDGTRALLQGPPGSDAGRATSFEWDVLRQGSRRLAATCGLQTVSATGARALVRCADGAFQLVSPRARAKALELPEASFAALAPNGELVGFAKGRAAWVLNTASGAELLRFEAAAQVKQVHFSADNSALCVRSARVECRALSAGASKPQTN